MKPRRVVITGLGALTPIGNSLPAYWEGLLSGTSGADLRNMDWFPLTKPSLTQVWILIKKTEIGLE